MIKRVVLLGLNIHVTSLSAQDIPESYGSTQADVDVSLNLSLHFRVATCP